MNNDLFSETEYTNRDGQPVSESEKISQDLQHTRSFAENILEDEAKKTNNYLLGFLGAFLAALLGGIGWGIIQSFFNDGLPVYFVFVLSFLLFILSVHGYTFFKVRQSYIMPVFGFVSTVAGIYLSQFTDFIITLTKELDKEAFSSAISFYLNDISELNSLIFSSDIFVAGMIISLISLCYWFVQVFRYRKIVKTARSILNE